MIDGLSIITGTLNRIQSLYGLIDNTIKKSSKIELILVDGGSDDGTQNFIKNLNNKQIKLIEIGKRSPYSDYMNKGIKDSKYSYICQWNDDVLMITPWDVVFKILEEPYDVFIFSWGRGKKDDLKDIERWKKESEKILYYAPGDTCLNFGVYRRSVFKDIGMYNNDFKYYYADKDMSERARIFNKKIRPCPDILVFEVSMPKRALMTDNDHAIFRKNLNIYTSGKIPKTVEFLDDSKKS